MELQALFAEPGALASLLAGALPACRLEALRITRCDLQEVITGRRGKLFALVQVDLHDEAGPRGTRRLVLQHYPDAATSIEEARKVFRRLRRLSRERGVRQVLRSWAAFVREQRLLILPFPFDYRLPSLLDACDPQAVAERFSAWDGLAASVAQLTPVRYVPEKRCQIRYDLVAADGTPFVVFGKITAEPEGERVVERMRVLHHACASSGVVGTPEPVGYVADWQMVVQRAVPGRTVYDLQRDGGGSAAVYQQVGAALALLHRTHVPGTSAHAAPEELTLLDAMLRKQVLAPPVQADAERLLARLRIADARLEPQALTTAHRDFYDKQLLFGTDGLWVIDLDTLARAPRALDAGNFLAHVQLRNRQGYLSGAAARAASRAFTAGYDVERLLDLDALRWWTAAALLRLSVIYAVRPAWRHLSPVLVDDARAELARTGPLEACPRCALMDGARP